MQYQYQGRTARRLMNGLLLSLTAGAMCTPTAAFADHAFNTDIPYASRGACEAASADFDNGDREWLAEAAGLSDGEIRSMLKRAWTCEQGADGMWYITDHREEVLGSDWWQRRLP